MSKWIAFLIAMLGSFIMAASAHAQESPQALAQKYGITFPIAEFGNCNDYASCYTFCEDPVNNAVCQAYFKAKGVPIKETAIDQTVSVAKQDLGCDSKESCEAFCQNPQNHDKCAAFVSKYKEKLGVKGGYVRDTAKLALQATNLLGCDSADSCKAFCAKEENRQKCDEFKSQVGCRGGIERKGPGRCNSEETCKAFCSDPNNFIECSKFGPPSGDQDHPGGFKGPGGCDSEESCMSYCQQNPHECKIVTAGGPGLIDPEKAADEYKRFCQAKPGKCVTQDANPFTSTVARTEFERFCAANPERCYEIDMKYTKKLDGDFVDYNDFCQKHPAKCVGGKDYNPAASSYPYPTYSPRPEYTPYPTYSPHPDYTPYPTYSPSPTKIFDTSSTPPPQPIQSSTPQPEQTTQPQQTVQPQPTSTSQQFTPAPSPAVHGIFRFFR